MIGLSVCHSDHYKDGHDIAELEALVSGITQTTQATLLLKKKKEMREVDDALAFMKKEYKERMQACEAKQVRRSSICHR